MQLSMCFNKTAGFGRPSNADAAMYERCFAALPELVDCWYAKLDNRLAGSLPDATRDRNPWKMGCAS